MSKSIGMICAFAVGVVIGAVAAYKVAQTKYRNIADEEINSVVERFEKRSKEEKSPTADEMVTADLNDLKVEKGDDGSGDRFTTSKNSMLEYQETIDRVGYNTISAQKTKPKKGGKKGKTTIVEEENIMKDDIKIYTIEPGAFNTLDGFDCRTLYYSSDNYILDSDYQILSDEEIALTIGHDPNGHFGEYEPDSVYIRNEELMCDYEILLSMKTHTEIMEG